MGGVSPRAATTDQSKLRKNACAFTCQADKRSEYVNKTSKFIGRCPEQVDEFLDQHIEPVLRKEAELLKKKNQDEITV